MHFCHWTTSHLHFYCSVWMYKLAACVKVEPDAEMQNSLFYGLQKLVRDQTPAGGGASPSQVCGYGGDCPVESELAILRVTDRAHSWPVHVAHVEICPDGITFDPSRPHAYTRCRPGAGPVRVPIAASASTSGHRFVYRRRRN